MTDEPQPDVSGTEQKQGKSIDFNGIATIGAVILSIVAISVSLLEVTTMRTQQRAAVWPYLQINGSYSSDGFKLLLNNKGVGPALIQDFVMTLDGEPVTDLDKMISDLVGEENAFSYDVYQTSNPANSVISSREEIRLFRVPLETETGQSYRPGTLFAERARNRVDIQVCYCSIHDDCWTAKLSTTGTESVKACS